MRYHFISGLPRSGSTLLASILRQNPAFEASIMTPVGRIMTETQTAMGPSNEADGFITDAHRARILRALLPAYYEDYIKARLVTTIFDNNRRWTANAALLENLYPDSKIICCMRAPADIVNSFERLFRAHPLGLSVIYGGRANLTVYDRATQIIKADGVLGFALNAFRSAYFSAQRKNLVLIEYDDLAQRPMATIAKLHKELGLRDYAYNFNRIEPIPGSLDFDRDVSTPGLHDLREKVSQLASPIVLPPDLYQNCPPVFWRVKEPSIPTG